MGDDCTKSALLVDNVCFCWTFEVYPSALTPGTVSKQTFSLLAFNELPPCHFALNISYFTAGSDYKVLAYTVTGPRLYEPPDMLNYIIPDLLSCNQGHHTYSILGLEPTTSSLGSRH